MLTGLLVGFAGVALLGAPLVLVWLSRTGRMDAWWDRESSRPMRPTPVPNWLKWTIAVYSGHLFAYAIMGAVFGVLHVVGLEPEGVFLWAYVAAFLAVWVSATRWVRTAMEDTRSETGPG